MNHKAIDRIAHIRDVFVDHFDTRKTTQGYIASLEAAYAAGLAAGRAEFGHPQAIINAIAKVEPETRKHLIADLASFYGVQKPKPWWETAKAGDKLRHKESGEVFVIDHFEEPDRWFNDGDEYIPTHYYEEWELTK